MATLKVVLTVLHLIIAVGLIAVVLFQSSKSQGLSGTIAGGAETFFGKNKGKTIDGLLAKLTVVLAILFVVTSVSLSFVGKKADTDATADTETEVVQQETELEGDITIETDAEVITETEAEAE